MNVSQIKVDILLLVVNNTPSPLPGDELEKSLAKLGYKKTEISVAVLNFRQGNFLRTKRLEPSKKGGKVPIAYEITGNGMKFLKGNEGTDEYKNSKANI